MSYSELFVALENILTDKVATVPTARNRKIDTSTPMEIGMAAKDDDGASVREDEDQRVWAVYTRETKACWTCGKTGHIAAWCRTGGNNILYAIDEDDSENVEEANDQKEDLDAWCLIEVRANEQWQEDISRRDKQMVKKANQA